MTNKLIEWLSLELDSSYDEIQEEDPEVYTLMAYILVGEEYSAAAEKKISQAEKYIQCGPIDFKSTDCHLSFLVERCNVSLIKENTNTKHTHKQSKAH